MEQPPQQPPPWGPPQQQQPPQQQWGAPAPMQAQPQAPMSPEASVESGRAFAYLSYVSMFVGLPLFIIPFMQRDNAFALQHAKHAGAAYILMIALAFMITVIGTVTCGLGFFLFPLLFFPLVPAVHGLILVSNGEWREPVLLFGIGEKLFGGVKPK